MDIWLDDYDSIKIVTKDGETVGEIKGDGKAFFKRLSPQKPKN